ncbi:hypothetical protein NPIL_408471 [Nephila pilipes]|uniref:Uncharacterized protein n=1 Tax=Nephila pilipes TaxID=299642 RepID=A0A8X6PIC9_NEPPI|nr:hypothetical protein NPIL_408471 [Nephila pilipes]
MIAGGGMMVSQMTPQQKNLQISLQATSLPATNQVFQLTSSKNPEHPRLDFIQVQTILPPIPPLKRVGPFFSPAQQQKATPPNHSPLSVTSIGDNRTLRNVANDAPRKGPPPPKNRLNRHS